MNRAYAISDTHFGHKNILGFESGYRQFDTIEEHDECLIDNWNTLVQPKDTVYHLGDVLFGSDNFRILSRLNGIKKLVLGNHDTYPIELYLQHFRKVYSSYNYKGLALLTHIPIHECQLNRFKMNIHGHLHHNKIDDVRYKCISVEHTELKPVLLSSLLNV